MRTEKEGLRGKILAKCIPRRHFAGHFAYMESISCQNQLILDTWRRYLAMKGRFSCPEPLWECIATRYCHDLPLRNALRLDLAKEGTFWQHANTQRRFLARLHPMLTRKKGLQDKGCRTKKEDRMMRSPYLMVNQAHPISRSNWASPMSRSNSASPMPRSNWTCLIPGLIEVSSTSGFVKVNPISAIQLRQLRPSV